MWKFFLDLLTPPLADQVLMCVIDTTGNHLKQEQKYRIFLTGPCISSLHVFMRYPEELIAVSSNS